MNINLKLGVYRRLDYRAEGLGDDSPRALELHNLRKRALHEVFDHEPNIQVIDWGNTDDEHPHEFVELVLSIAGSAAFQYVIVPGVKWLGNKLAEKAIDAAVIELVKAIVARLRPKQEEKQILDFALKLPDGTVIAVDPPDRYGTVRIQFSDGSIQSIEYIKENE